MMTPSISPGGRTRTWGPATCKARGLHVPCPTCPDLGGTMIDLQQTVRGLRLAKLRRDRQTGDEPESGPGNLHRSTLCAANCALVRPDHRPGRAGADTGSETSDRSVPGLLPDESAHHVDHPDGQSCRFRTLRARGGSCAPGSPAPGGPGRRWPARLPGHADATPVLPVAARAGLPGSRVLVRLQADEANRIQSPRLPAAGQAHAARAGGAGGRRDRVVARRADSWRTPGGRSPARGISGWSGRSRSERPAGRARHGAS